VVDLASLGVPMKLDNTRFASVDLSEIPCSEFKSPPNQLLPVGELLWLQDSAHDSFSQGESLWETLAEIVMGKKDIYKSRTSPGGIPTVRVVKLKNKFYTVDTRRPLIYKVAFNPKQLIPVQVIPSDSQEAMDKLHCNKDSGRTVLLTRRLHDAVPRGFWQLGFVREAISHPETTRVTGHLPLTERMRAAGSSKDLATNARKKLTLQAIIRLKDVLSDEGSNTAAPVRSAGCSKSILDVSNTTSVIRLKNVLSDEGSNTAAPVRSAGCSKSILDVSSTARLIRLQDFLGDEGSNTVAPVRAAGDSKRLDICTPDASSIKNLCNSTSHSETRPILIPHHYRPMRFDEGCNTIAPVREAVHADTSRSTYCDGFLDVFLGRARLM